MGREAATVSLGTKSRRRKMTCAALLRVITAERRKLLQAAREEMLSAVITLCSAAQVLFLRRLFVPKERVAASRPTMGI